MNPIRTLSLLAIVFFLTGFKAQEEHQTISNSGITIECPADWKSNNMPNYPILVSEPPKTEGISVICNFAVEVDSSYSSLESYLNDYKVKMKAHPYFENWKVKSENPIEFKGYQGQEIMATFSMFGFKGKTRVVLIQQGKRTLNLSTTSSTEEYEQNKIITDRIFESVTFQEQL